MDDEQSIFMGGGRPQFDEYDEEALKKAQKKSEGSEEA